jgi:[protein-PII] uridylyltransferase
MPDSHPTQVNVSASPTPVSPQALLENARRELTDHIARGDGGRAALERYADRIDALVQQLCLVAPAPRRPVAVIAVGGYGRRQLCLHSDVDVLVLFDGSIGDAEEQFLRGFLHPLWDLGLTVGHQVRELDDFSRLETDNPEFLLALVDARVVAGDTALGHRLVAAFHTAPTHAYIIDALERLVDDRHRKFNDTIYQLEPDVKEAPGALRDLMAAQTIVALSDPGLLRYGPSDTVRLAEAEDFLLRIRSILHLDATRNQNVLSHQMQEKAADVLGYPGVLPQQRVERLMGDYFRHARIINRTLAWVRQAAPDPVGQNLGRSFDGIRFIDLRQAAVQPATWLDAFQAAIEAECGVSNEALALIQQNAERFGPEDFYPTPANRAALLKFLTPRAGLYDRLSEMLDCGLLGRLFPEFQKIASRVVRDFYHKYTVDEHTLLTIRNLERLATSPSPGRERFGSLIPDLEAPELLVLALLYHDVGKWRDEDHSVESVRMAQAALDRLGLSDENRELVLFLIRHHLRMSQVAFRRDTEDPEIVRQFAELVGVETQLKALCLITLADIEAVSLETLTPWKEELLWRLYVDTYNQLTQGYGDELIGRGQSGIAELLAGRPADLSEAEITTFLEGFPRRYLRLFDREATYRHVRLSRNIHADEVHPWLEQKGSLWELTVVTLDKAFLFSNICGVLSSFGMDIVRGQAMTNPNGLVLDIFQFTDRERFFELNPGAKEKFVQVLDDVVSGRSDARTRLERREQSVFHRRVARSTPVIHCDNQSSARYTILDIIADDALGLLHRISRVISEQGCAVELVLISTEGQKAIDVFHLTKDRAKLSDADQLRLTDHLQRILEGGYETH